MRMSCDINFHKCAMKLKVIGIARNKLAKSYYTVDTNLKLCNKMLLNHDVARVLFLESLTCTL